MAADALTARYEKLFDAFDADKDGTVESADFDRPVERITKMYGLAADDHRAEAVQIAYGTFSSHLMGASGGGRLSKDQFVAALRALVDDPARVGVVESLSKAMFEVVDRKRVDEVSQDELQFLADAVWDIAPNVAWDAFEQLDTDSDGAIGRHEFVHGVHEFLTNPDAQAAGGGLVLGVR
ncbi:EF-hand domain-containing protein [Streptomyces sp. NPDC090303]|uniref:EF-hand domain-containing protein n=1 Tax=Streptomyces sp. NPDC090303 TaxID=3365960 RepID=UPI0037FA1977